MSEEINENEHEEELTNLENQEEILDNDNDSVETITKVTGMYKEWFLDYASYVILERAVPRIEDGLKPVQRRIRGAFATTMKIVFLRVPPPGFG